ncbi:MAG: type I-MYXAN CRISPR-associated protein Cas6/Cmx6 [Burkholderiales bacterium]|nr:type I-MYXAN CRISPR-associated protein Cas6/Cmx6 [Burkholderiales bacterium]
MDMVDVAFALRGVSIPADHGWRLFRLLAERLDWLEDETEAGVHPIRGSRAVAGQIFLGSRARLMLRLPRSRAEQSFALSGARFELGNAFEVGKAHLRPLFAHGTLYSPFATTGTPDEAEFQSTVSRELEDAGIRCKIICGRARRAQTQDAEIVGYSLMLHELSPEHSLKMQATGLGGGRKLGCGIFIPHKSAAAVGA